MFADSVLFDMMLKTAYEDGIDNHQDLIDRDMTLGFYIPEIIQTDVIKVIISYLAEHAVAGGLDEILRLRTLPDTRYNIRLLYYVVHISLLMICSGERTVSFDSFSETDKMILDKVLSDDRSVAYVTTINEINYYYLECNECNWYKSKQSFLSEARFST